MTILHCPHVAKSPTSEGLAESRCTNWSVLNFLANYRMMGCFIRELLVLFYRLKPSYNFVGPFCEGWNGFSCISMGTECNEAPIFFTYKPLKRSAYHFSFIFNDLKRAMKNETSSDHQRVCQFWVTSTLDWNVPSVPRVLLCGSLWGPTRHSSQEAVWKIGGGVKHKELGCLNRVTKKKKQRLNES